MHLLTLLLALPPMLFASGKAGASVPAGSQLHKQPFLGHTSLGVGGTGGLTGMEKDRGY